jgi:hypothetical protein
MRRKQVTGSIAQDDDRNCDQLSSRADDFQAERSVIYEAKLGRTGGARHAGVAHPTLKRTY